MTTSTENPDAGQGPVLLDIGGDVGALIVSMPAETEGLEVEIRPRGATALEVTGEVAEPDHGTHGHANHQESTGRHDHGPARFPHVAVVGRRAPGGVQYSLVYPSLEAGDYELCPIPGDDVMMTATVVGGRVTERESTDGMLHTR